MGERPFRASQIRHWLYKKNVRSFEEMENLPKDFRKGLSNRVAFSTLTMIKALKAEDGTTKYAFSLYDNRVIETVLIPEKDHYTLCVSTQVGCAMGCAFCNTARLGFIRNLWPWEILDQILESKRALKEDIPITNIVFMGMGEPLMNYRHLSKALKIILDQDGLAFSHRKVTVSTAGVVPFIGKLGNDFKVNLAVSLNAPNDEIRSRLMPINKKYPLRSLIEILKGFPLPNGRRITFEYVLIRGINDSPQLALELCERIKGIPSKVNLIPFNEFPGCSFQRPDNESVDRFQEILFKHSLTAIVRKSKGADIMAACGQLSGSL